MQKIVRFAIIMSVLASSIAFANAYSCTSPTDVPGDTYTQMLVITDHGITFGDRNCARMMDNILPYVYLCAEGGDSAGVMVFNPGNLTVRYDRFGIGSQPYESPNGLSTFNCQRR